MGAKWSRPASRYGALSGPEAGSRRAFGSSVTGPFTLAVDAMGGDNAPSMVIDGLEIAAERHPSARFLLVGDEAALTAQARQGGMHHPACTGRDHQRHEADSGPAQPPILHAAGG